MCWSTFVFSQYVIRPLVAADPLVWPAKAVVLDFRISLLFCAPGFTLHCHNPCLPHHPSSTKFGGLQFSQEGRNPTRSTIGEVSCEDLLDLVCGEALSSSSGGQKTVCGSHFTPSTIDPSQGSNSGHQVWQKKTLPHEPSYQSRICLDWQLKASQCDSQELWVQMQIITIEEPLFSPVKSSTQI